MGDLADIYEETRIAIRDLLESRLPEDLQRDVPATPGWRVRDILAHLIGDLDSIATGIFPTRFFETIGDEPAIAELNTWAQGHVTNRADRSIDELFKEWDEAAAKVAPMLRGHQPWADGLPFFVDRVLVTDLGIHQQDIYGAFGIERDRDSAIVRIGVGTYVGGIAWRLAVDGVGTIAFEADKRRVVGVSEEPDATVRATPFELFRALSGRRSPDQIRAYDWTGDPEPFIKYFYPYGMREEGLVE